MTFDQTTYGYRLTDYLAIYGVLPGYKDLYSGAYTVTKTFASAGYYNYTFPAPVYFPMRTVVNMKFSSGSIAVDTSGINGGYSDVQWDYTTSANRIMNSNNYIFYLSVISNRAKGNNDAQRVFMRRQFSAAGNMLLHASFVCNNEVTSDFNLFVGERKIETWSLPCTHK